MHRKRLSTHHQRLRGAGVFAGRKCCQHHGTQQKRRLFALLADEPRNVPLGDVAELMGQHGSELITGCHHADQTQMQAQVTARQRKGVDRAVAP
ncbi:hypothetical protein D3C71_1123030 [compost metagenome]